ncbi:MAG: thioredoxin domain-containing protein [Pseudomonadota bacterium]
MKKILFLLITIGLFFVFSCEIKKEANKPSAVKPSAPTAVATGDAAIVDGEAISLAELDKNISSKLYRFEERIYSMKIEALDEIINEKIIEKEAQAKNTTQEKLLEEAANNIKVDQKELDEFYERFKNRLAGTEEEKKERLTAIFKRKKEREIKTQFIEELRKSHKIEILLTPPPLPVADIKAEEYSPYIGKKDAPVEIIEFSEFKCPYCKKAAKTIKDVAAKFKDEVKVVFRHFPIPSHKGAFEAAEASMCANDQGKFWEYHDVLFEGKGDFDKAMFVKIATDLKLDIKKFEACYDSHKHKANIEKDRTDGEKAGVSGTPGFFVNKKVVAGAREADFFEDLINRELGRK